MANIDNEPIRLENPASVERRLPAFATKLRLPTPSPLSGSFALALLRRRSGVKFGPMAFADLCEWLYYCGSVQAVSATDPNRQRRFVPSFGALHPSYILLGDPDGRWCFYIPHEHALGELEVDSDSLARLRTRSMHLFHSPEAILVALVTDLDLVESYYASAFGLIARDAGVLLGHAALVASTLGLSFRILGFTGESLLEKGIRNLPFRPIASGLAWIGRS